MRKVDLAKRVGIVTAIAAIIGFAALRVSSSTIPGISFLAKGQVVYTGKAETKLAGLTATETFLNIPMNWEDAVQKVQREMPSAILREDGNGPYFVIPQTQNGRVLLSEFPQQSITVRPGKVMRVGARMMVGMDSGDTWAHVQIQDFRQPSALESAFNWLGDKIGI